MGGKALATHLPSSRYSPFQKTDDSAGKQAAAVVLADALVTREGEMDQTFDPVTGHVLPAFPLHEAQEIMTRADFVREFDRRNLFTITSAAHVRASSVPMQQAFRQICSAPGFRRHLDATIKRIGDIESLGRTRELVAKDLVNGEKYDIQRLPSSSSSNSTMGDGADKGFQVRLHSSKRRSKSHPARTPDQPAGGALEGKCVVM